MRQRYKTIAITTKQGFGGSKGTVDTAEVDSTLNKMAADGWSLVTVESLEHTAGSRTLLCIFEDSSAPPRGEA